MAFRYQVISVGLWRGKIKRWNTTFHRSTSDNVAAIYSLMQKSGYMAPGDVVGACSGGTAQINVYDTAGGPPVVRTTYFDWEAPATWIPYTGSLWSDVPEGTPLDAAGESALVVVGNLDGLSASGKPRTTRRYLHAVPSRSSAVYSDPDVLAATVAKFETSWTAAYLASPTLETPASVTVEDFYGSHQRVRGRRKTVASVAAQSFSLGVLAGGGATTSGQGVQFPGGEF